MLKMADGKTSERTTSGSRLPLEVESASRLVDDTETDVEIFSQRAVTEATYFDRDFGENDGADNCPNFSIYSATSIDFTKDIDADAKITPPKANVDPYDEGDENLVQMTDDDVEDDITSAEELVEPANTDRDRSFDRDTFDERDFFSDKETCNNKESSPVDAQQEEPEDVHSSTLENNVAIAEQSEVEEQDEQNKSKSLNSSAENLIAEADSPTVCNKSVDQPSTVKTKAVIKKPNYSLIPNKKVFLELYDDSDWEEWTNEKMDEDKSVGNKPSKISDIEKLTESISDVEDERGYTPCQDELVKARNLSDDDQEVLTSIGIGGLDTELISEDEGNIFTDDIPRNGNKQRVVELNIEDGEIVEKNKITESVKDPIGLGNLHKEKKRKSKEKDKENKSSKSVLAEPFKKISAKDRNYRDKDKRRKSRSRSRSLSKRYNYRKKKDHSNRKKEKRKDLEWYDVRNMITEKNKRRSDKDEYGRERRPSVSKSRSRDRLRSKSRGRSRRRRDSDRRNRSRGRSGYGRFHNSRSKSRSITRSRSISVERPPRKRKSHSTRRRSRSLSKDRYNNAKIVAPARSKSKSPVRKIKKAKRKRSASYQRDWTPSWSSPNNSPVSESPNPNKRMPSPSWTPPLRENMSNAQNLTVIVSNKDANKKKKEKRKKTDSKQKETSAAVKQSKKRRREDQQMPMDQPSKEVFASGDNILVSVSFNKNKNTTENPPVNIPQMPEQTVASKRKNKTQEPEQRKRRNSKSKDKPSKANARRNRYLDLANRKPIAIIDLDKSPFKELTPSPRAIIVLTDSESEEKDQISREERMHEEPNARKETRIDNISSYNTPSTFTNNTGPKTPPEPQINFSLQLKPAPKLRNLNLLYDQEDENENDDLEQDHSNMASDHIDDGPHKGPNTPPEPPNSPPSSPDAYDPFEPTKSASQSPNTQDTSPDAPCLPVDKIPVSEEKTETTAMVSQVPPPEDKPLDVGLGTNTVEKVLALLTQRFSSTPEKHLITSMPQNDTGKTSMENEQKSLNATMENKVPSPDVSKSGVTILSNVLLQPNMLSSVLKCTTSESGLVYTSGAPVSSTPMITTLNASRGSLFNSTNNNVQSMTATSSNKNSKLQTRPSPIKSNPIKPMVKTAVIKPGIRPYMVNKVNKPSKHDTDADMESPYSPGSDDFDDLFEPPPTDAASKPVKNQKASKSPAKKSSHNDFDHLFMSPSYKPSISSKSEKRFYSKKYRRAAAKTNKTQVGVKIDDDQLKVLEELPSSAVEMQVKDKFMKKLNRQERVVEEVKVVLKPHYAKKHISKEQYKDILRRAVPKICHNRSGEINPQRIHKLIEAYVKKARYSRKTNV